MSFSVQCNKRHPSLQCFGSHFVFMFVFSQLPLQISGHAACISLSCCKRAGTPSPARPLHPQTPSCLGIHCPSTQATLGCSTSQSTTATAILAARQLDPTIKNSSNGTPAGHPGRFPSSPTTSRIATQTCSPTSYSTNSNASSTGDAWNYVAGQPQTHQPPQVTYTTLYSIPTSNIS